MQQYGRAQRQDGRFDHAGVLVGIGLVVLAMTTALQAAPAPAEDLVASPYETLVAEVNESLGLYASTVVALELDTPITGRLTAAVPMDGEVFHLDLVPHSVRAPGYRLLIQVEDGSVQEIDPAPERTYRGVVRGMADSLVAGSWLDDGLYARIMLPGNEQFWIEPIAGRVFGAAPGDYVVYRQEDVIPNGLTCAADLLARPDDTESTAGPRADCGDGNLCVAELACDADYEFFSRYGTVAAVENRINTVINTVNVQYERDVSITHQISAIIVRTSSSDPYTSSDASTLLSQFRNHWLSNHGDIDRDLAELFTGRNMNGSTIGIAWVGVVCGSLAYSVVESDCCGSLSCSADLSAHEIGHNWDADHCSCPSHTMNASLTCSNEFHPTYTIPAMINYRDSRTCLDAEFQAPANDDSAAAIAVGNGTYTGTTLHATTDGSASCGDSTASPDVWYSFSPPDNGSLTVHTCEATLQYDTVISVHDAAPGTSGNELGCNDDDTTSTCPNNRQSLLTVPVNVGQTYWIRVSGWDGDEGDFTLTVDGPADLVPPSPSPASFESPPTPYLTPSFLQMVASMATDSLSPPVLYQFLFVGGGAGGLDSVWQTGRTYINGGLAPNASYSYVVWARDSADPPNMTATSDVATGWTMANVPATPTIGAVTAATIDVTPVRGTNPTSTRLSIQVSSSDASWNGQWVDATGQATAAAVYRTESNWGTVTVQDLSPGTEYCFEVRAINGDDSHVTDASSTACGTTTSVVTAQIESGESCRLHGGAEVCLNLDGNNLDPRGGGVTKLGFTMDQAVDSVAASADCVNAGAYSGTVSVSTTGGTRVEVEFDPPLPDADCCTITLSGDADDAYQVRPLAGDVDRGGDVLGSDMLAVKPYIGQPLSAATAFADVDTSGEILGSDMLAVKPYIGATAPACP